MRHRSSVLFFPLYILGDVITLNAAFLGAYLLKFGTLETVAKAPYAVLWGVFNAICLPITNLPACYQSIRLLVSQSISQPDY